MTKKLVGRMNESRYVIKDCAEAPKYVCRCIAHSWEDVSGISVRITENYITE
jgi:hypothetical protein